MEKVIFVLPSIKITGGNRVIIEIANELVKSGIDIEIIYPYNSKEKCTFNLDESIKLISIGKFSNNKLFKLKNLFQTFFYINKSYKNQNLILTDPIMSIFSPLITNNKVFRYIQADDYRIFDDLYLLKSKYVLKVYKKLTKISYNYKSVKYIFNSQYTYNKFMQISKRKDVPLKIVHPAIRKNVFHNKNIRKSKETNICIIARRHPLKGFIDFIEPLNKGKIRGIDNVFVLSPDDLSNFDLSKVHLIKPRNDEEIAYYMNISHIFVSTSWWEGFGLPPLEAMSSGCAVVLTNAGGVNEYAMPNYNCLMYEPKNQEELVEKLNLLIKDKALQKKLSQNAVLTAEKFSWETSAKQLLKALQE